MDLVRLGEFERLQDEINKLFNFEGQAGSGLFDRKMSPAVDVIEKEESVVVRCDMPGIHREDLDLSLAGNVLTVKGEKKLEKRPDNSKSYRNETWSGIFQRTISLPESIDPTKVEAEMHDGVLGIRVAKREDVRPRQIKVKVG